MQNIFLGDSRVRSIKGVKFRKLLINEPKVKFFPLMSNKFLSLNNLFVNDFNFSFIYIFFFFPLSVVMVKRYIQLVVEMKFFMRIYALIPG